jgi:MFS family permease
VTAPTSARERLLGGVGRNVVALGFVSLLTDISSEMLIYVVPLFLANVLAASSSVIGLIEGIVESASALLRLVSGAISDRLGRRRLLVGIGYTTSVAAKALYLVAASWPVVLLARLGDRVGKGIRTAPRDALIADSTPPEARGRAFGLHRAMDTTGAVIGVATAAMVVALFQGDALHLSEDTFHALVLLALVPGVAAVGVIVVAVRDVKRTSVAAQPGRPGLPAEAEATAPPMTGTARPRSWTSRAKMFPTAFWIFVGATVLFTLGNSSDAFIALRSQSLGVTVRDLLLVVVLFNVVDAVIALPAGALSDVIGRSRLLLVAWGVYAATYAGFALAGSSIAVPLLWVLYGVYYGILEAVGRAFIADLAPVEARATAFGIYNMAIGLALLPASIMAGLLWDNVSQAATFWFGAACAAAAAVVLGVFVRQPHGGAGPATA